MPAELLDAYENQVPVSLVILMNEISISIVLALFGLPCVFILTIFNHGLLSYYFLFNSPICMHLYTLSCISLSFNLHVITPISLPLFIFHVIPVKTLLTFILFVSASPQNCCYAHSKIAKESIIPREQREGICENPGRTGKQHLHCVTDSPLESTCW